MTRKARSGSRFEIAWSWPPAAPIAVRGGIKAQRQRGAFGTRWWAKRWLAVLDGLSLGSRLQRGRSYARSGQVVDLVCAAGSVTAKVQGSRPQPYRVTFTVATLDATAWARVIEAIGREARFAAKLVLGEMPEDVEQAFTAAGVSLFPNSVRDLRTTCSCPDASNPCKHIAAVLYLLGEEFDRDPFVLFSLRGRTKDEVLGALGSLHVDETVLEAVPALDADLERFWTGGDVTISAHVVAPPGGRRVVPSLAFWRGEEALADVLARIDAVAGEEARRLLGEMERDSS